MWKHDIWRNGEYIVSCENITRLYEIYKGDYLPRDVSCNVIFHYHTVYSYCKFLIGNVFWCRIIPVSAHSAYDKSAQYFNIKLWRVPVNKDFRADVRSIRRHITRNTILVNKIS